MTVKMDQEPRPGGPFRPGGPLFGSEYSVSGITESRADISIFVKASVEVTNEYLDIRMSFAEPL